MRAWRARACSFMRATVDGRRASPSLMHVMACASCGKKCASKANNKNMRAYEYRERMARRGLTAQQDSKKKAGT